MTSEKIVPAALSLSRRGVLRFGAAAGVTLATMPAGANILPGMRRIACEEGFSIPELIDAVDAFMSTTPEREPGLAALMGPGGKFPRMPQLLDPEVRIRDMDAVGIDMQILVLNSPGVQIFEAQQASELARLANDRAACWMARWPGRFAPLAAFAPQDPAGAVRELERAVGTLGLKGGIVNSSTQGAYLSDRKFWPILETIEALKVPLYLHPREPRADMLAPYLEQNLQGAVWGYAAEAGLHALSMIMAGVFDQFPDLIVVLGHNGEGIPFQLDRIDNRYATMNRGGSGNLKRMPSAYFRDNFVVTTSGANWSPAVRFCQQVLGPDKVLFGLDYPFEDGPQTVVAADGIAMTKMEREMFYFRNAERVFNLT